MKSFNFILRIDDKRKMRKEARYSVDIQIKLLIEKRIYLNIELSENPVSACLFTGSIYSCETLSVSIAVA